MLGRKVEQHDHPLARHHVPQAMGVLFTDLVQDSVGCFGNVDRERRDPQLVDDELRVLEALRARGPVGHPHADDIVRSERGSGEKSGQRRIHAARQTDESFLEAAPAVDFVFQETHKPAPGQLRVDGQRICFTGHGVDEGGSLGRERGEGRCTIGGGVKLHRSRPLPSPLSRFQSLDEHRQSTLQVREQRRIGARRRQGVQIDIGCYQRFLEQRPARQDSPCGIDDRRRARESLPALEAHQVREGDEYAVLLRDAAHDALPPNDRCRQGLSFAVFVFAEPSCRRCARHDEQLSAFERGDRRGQGMPCVFANENRGPASPIRLERSDAVLPAIDESLFVENAVGGKEHLAMDVAHVGFLFSERRVQGRVVDVVLEALVEADGDIDLGSLIRRGEITRERSRRDRQLLHSAFDEVAGGRRFGEDDEVRLGIELGGLRDDGADAGDILRVLALGWAELRERDGNGRHARKIIVSLQQAMEFAFNRRFPADDSYRTS